ncbi:MAG: hypothetical protein ABFD97_07125 [Syntrophobacter sp.]
MKCDCQKLKFKVLAKGMRAVNRPYKMLARCAECHRQYVCTVNMLEGGLAPSCHPEERSVNGRIRNMEEGVRLTGIVGKALEQRRSVTLPGRFPHADGRQ